MFRKFHFFLFILLFSSIFCFANTFADGNDDPAETIIPDEGFKFPVPKGPTDIPDLLEAQIGPEAIIGSPDFEKMRDLPINSRDYQLGRKVGWIAIPARNAPGYFWICTGFLVGPDLFMTNHHCLHDNAGLLPMAGTRIYMDYYQERAVDPTRGGITARVSAVVKMDEDLDYALLRLDRPIGNAYGWLELDTTIDPDDRSQSVKMISHPDGRSKEIVRRNSQVIPLTPDSRAQYPYILAYLADSEKGSSGSPVFLRDGTGVIAIHHSGASRANFGSLMSHIVPEIQQYLPGNPGVPSDPVVPPSNPTTPESPDLVVETPLVSSDYLFPGDSFTLSATVRNQGTAAAPATTLRFYQSLDTAITISNTEIGTADVAALNPDGTAEISITLNAPITLGTHHYGACVDTVNNEADSNNNCSPPVTLTVSDPESPDLVVETPLVSNDYLFPGDSFTLSATVRNQGTAAAPATTLRFYQSLDTTITTSDTEIGTADVAALNPDGTDEISITLNAPMTLGTHHYYGACVDTVNNEDDSDNNCSPPVTLTVSDTLPVYMYWTDADTDTIRRAHHDGSNIKDIVRTGLRTPTGIALDLTARKIYWTDPGTDKIQRANLDGSNIEDIVTTGLRTPTGIALDLTARKIYWTDPGTDKIQRANLDGSNIEDIVTTGLRIPTGIALDLPWGKVYWIDADTDKIQRANLDGSNIEDIVTTGLRTLTSIALDLVNGKVYWTDAGTDKIQRANLDGSNIEDIVTAGLSTPTGIAVDPDGKVYWIDAGTDKIQRANLDGSNIEDLVTTGLSTPTGIALSIPQTTGPSTFPDLVVGAPQASKVNLQPGESFSLQVSVRNQGAVTASATTLRFYQSADSTITPSDVEVGTSPVSVLAPNGFQKPSLSLTAPTSPGTYYYGACVDPAGNERQTDNNCSTVVTLTIPTTLTFRSSAIADQTFVEGTAIAPFYLPLATGGTVPYTYSLSPIPAGLSFTSAERLLSGTPTTAATTSVTYTVTDANDTSAALKFTIEVTEAGPGPLDVNGDGHVDVLDLVRVAFLYGTRGAGLPEDVNTDGVVDLSDLTAVAQGIDAAGGGINGLTLIELQAALLAVIEQVGAIEGLGEAPMRSTHVRVSYIAYDNVAAALNDVKHFAIGDTRAVLSAFLQLLSEIVAIPETTALLPNYPNPFNPETWIPYHLAEDADVTLHIYAVNGTLVRTLALGHHAAGAYQSQSRAAYWDGKNTFGEPVASGVYFYTFTADDFTATRKMLIRK